MMNAWKKFRRTLSAFRVAQAGNVAITFAFASLPIIGFVGAAVDYSRANSVKAAMQTALDSTALMLAKEAAGDTEDQLKTNATKYFTALFTRQEAKDVDVQVSYGTTGGSNIQIQATAALDAQFVRVLGYDTFHLRATSTAKWGITRLRVALVLDNTGSMSSDGKMTALQAATKSLIDQLHGAVTTDGDVYVSIIPFAKDVNLGNSNFAADWIYWGTAPGDNNVNNPGLPIQDATTSDNTSWNATRGTCSSPGPSTRSDCFKNVGTCSVAGYTNQDSCTSSGMCSNGGYSSESTCTSHGTCSNPSYTKKSSCQSHGGTWTVNTWTSYNGVWTVTGTWKPRTHNTTNWNGCVMDRGNPDDPDTTYNFDTNAEPPDPVTPRWSSLYAAEQYGSCPKAVKGLTYEWDNMKTLVDSMTPNGNTNQAIGLQVGWMSLVGGGPFTVPDMDPAFKYQQVIILLTDGLNTQDRWYDQATDPQYREHIDARQQLTCDNVKAAKVDLYTIQVNTGGDPTSTLLQNCASDPAKFYLLTSADQITATFQTIGTNLTKLRVAQ
jgi:Flp pilus assembly protein TadG